MTTVTVPEKVGIAAGFEFDLSREWVDVYGARWSWTGESDATGMPMMRTREDAPERLSQVYWTYGPLIPAPRPVTAADRFAALTAPTCITGAKRVKQATATPRTMAGLLGRLRGRSA